jgi:hypothetical protein
MGNASNQHNFLAKQCTSSALLTKDQARDETKDTGKARDYGRLSICLNKLVGYGILLCAYFLAIFSLSISLLSFIL